MFKAPPTRPSRSLLVYALLPFLLTTCSGDSGGGGDSGYNEALETYKGSAAKRTAEVAEAIAAAYVEQLAVGPPDDAFFKQFEGKVSELAEYLCSQIKDLQGKAGSGDAKAGRLDELRVASEDIVRDGFVGALIGKVLATPQEQREQLLSTLGVKAVGSDGAELQGTAALNATGLLNNQGQIAIPNQGTDQYTRYERWLTEQARGFAGINSKLMGNARTEIDRCSST